MDGKINIMSGRRSQAAMEFIMTYGWAILVVLAAIVALAYFGVLNPAKFFPESCTLPSTTGMACLDFKVQTDSAHLLIINSGGRDLTINNMTVGSCSQGFGIDMPNGQSHLFSITGCSFGSVGEKIKEPLVISYTDFISGFTKTSSGAVTAKVS
jgi:hypothetical protein